MRTLILFMVFPSVLTCFAQGFPANAISWPVPVGGLLANNIDYGINYVSGAMIASDVGDRIWFTRDMNGDGLPDLVVTSEKQANGKYYTFDPGPDTHWNVHLGNGSGFEEQPLEWQLPEGGFLQGGEVLGYNSELPGPGTNDVGATFWRVDDITGDGRPDLIVTAIVSATGTSSFSPNNNDYWNVFSNTGSGFAMVPITWGLPDGGAIYSGQALGFSGTTNSATTSGDVGSELWGFRDMDNDGLRDLVVTSEKAADYPMGFNPNASSFWKVYRNNGSGFNDTYDAWALPDGGSIFNNDARGFYILSSQDVNGNTGSQNWGLIDINADDHIDLIVTSEKLAGSPTRFSAFTGVTSKYWKVFLGTAGGFSTTALEWSLPAVGFIDTGVEVGVISLNGFAPGSYDLGSEMWHTVDMNGDRWPDLVVTSEKTATVNALMFAFDPGPMSYWKLFLNTGNGFDQAYSNWSVPDGGYVDGSLAGFWQMSFGTTNVDEGSQSWSCLDMDGSGTVDLVVTSEQDASFGHPTFGTPGAQHWNVHLNPYWVGMNEQESGSAAMLAWPNPTNGTVRVSIGGNAPSQVIITDMRGSVVMRTFGDLVQFDALAPGPYVISAIDRLGRRYTTLEMRD